MRLLFALDEIYSGESANIRLVKQLAKNLAAKGADVRFLVNCLPEQQSDFAGLAAEFFTCTADKASYEAVKAAREAGKGTAGQALALLAHPAAAWNIVSTVLWKKTLAEAPWRRAIEQACAHTCYDAVIAVSCPHYVMLALGGAAISAKKICYMLDPYWSNTSMPYAVSLKREQALYQKIDGAFITDLMYAENQACALAAYKEKMHVLPFPGISEKQDTGTADTYTLAGKIQMVYIGNLYPAARDPEPLFRLLAALPAEFGLSIFGGGREGFAPGYFAAWQKKLGDRLLLHGPVDAKTASDLLFRGDVLVNVGNRVANQLPSKVFEYLSAGRPILNLFCLDVCPSLPYFARCPLALNVRAGDFSPETLQKVENFCRAAKGRSLPYRQIEALFPANTAEAVAAEFLRVAQEIAGA
ncbi:MAG: hypothetical protein LKJ90_07530 [Faecalibacterium sp.]|jgi:hypothetical protein|nr:hypothetical protein [Faecalibacterium sp.]